MLRHSHGNVCAEIGARNKETPLSPRIFSFMLLFPVFSVQVLITDTCVLHVAVEFSPRMRRTLARERPVLWSSCTVPEREMVGGQLAWRSPVRHFALTHRVASCLLPSPGLVEHGGQNVWLLCAQLTQIFHSPLSCLSAINAPSSLCQDGVIDACGSLNDLILKL